MAEKTIHQVPRIERAHILKAFRRLGYSEDVTRNNISVLRQMDFPFRRITLPDHPQISTELIRLYLMDLGIDFEVFYRLVQDVYP
jgi:hypothetical protein